MIANWLKALLHRVFLVNRTILLVLLAACSCSYAYALEETPIAKSDIRVLIDISGSMKKNDPNNLRRPALDLLLQLFQEEHRAGVWTFGQQVNMLQKHGTVNDAWKQEAQSIAERINSVALYTNIGEVLEQANYDSAPLSKGPQEQQAITDIGYDKTVILLTDGMVDINTDPAVNVQERERILNEILPRYQADGITIHTVALSDNADKELLETLSHSTDGLFAIAQNADDLTRIFLQAFDQSSSQDKVPLENNSFLIDSSVEEFTALVFKSADNLPTEIISPDETRLTADNNADYVNWFSTEQYDLVTVQRPLEGEWLINAAVDPDNRVTVVSDFSLAIAPIANNLFLNDRVNLQLTLLDEDKPLNNLDLQRLLKVQALLDKSHFVLMDETLPLNEETPGVYQYTIDHQKEPGRYNLDIRVDGNTFKREKSISFNVRNPFELIADLQAEEGILKLGIQAEPAFMQTEDKFVTIRATLTNSAGEITLLTLTKDNAAQVPSWLDTLSDLAPDTYSYNAELTVTNRDEHQSSFTFDEQLIQIGESLTRNNVEEPKQPEQEEKLEEVAEENVEEVIEETSETDEEQGMPLWLTISVIVGVLVFLAGSLFLSYKLILGKKPAEEETADEDEAGETKTGAPPVAEKEEDEEEVVEEIEEPIVENTDDSTEEEAVEEEPTEEAVDEPEEEADISDILGDMIDENAPEIAEEAEAEPEEKATEDVEELPEEEPEPEADQDEADDEFDLSIDLDEGGNEAEESDNNDEEDSDKDAKDK